VTFGGVESKRPPRRERPRVWPSTRRTAPLAAGGLAPQLPVTDEPPRKPKASRQKQVS